MPLYENLDPQAKKQLILGLLREQGYTCCYCMCRIDESNVRVEHWHPQSRFPAEQLEYCNLLAACNGNEGGGTEHEHCDVRKGNKLITYNPADPKANVELKLEYTTDGEVRAIKRETAFQKDLQSDALNLNCERLVEDRRRALSGLFRYLKRRATRLGQGEMDKLASHWDSRDSQDRLQPYSGAVLYFLKRLAKQASYRSAKRPHSGSRKPS